VRECPEGGAGRGFDPELKTSCGVATVDLVGDADADDVAADH